LAEQRFRQGQAEDAETAAAEAIGIGERFGDADVSACARYQLGRLLISHERIRGGLTLLDEAMLAATRGELSPIMTGLVYCGVLTACARVYALGRALEWT